MVTPLDERAQDALRRFRDAVGMVSFGIDVLPGRLVYIDNRIALHSRDRFKANYDDFGRPLRWIQRVFVAANLWNHRSLLRTKERVFDASPIAA